MHNCPLGRPPSVVLRPFTARYVLASGVSGRLHVAAQTSGDAMTITMDAVGEQLAYCSVKPINRSAQ